MTYFERTVIKCDTNRDSKEALACFSFLIITIKHIQSSWKEKDTDQDLESKHLIQGHPRRAKQPANSHTRKTDDQAKTQLTIGM